MTGPLVSIGLPTFNRPDSLERAIDHLIAQSWPHLEIIVSDNASPDPRVGEILRARANIDTRIRLFTQPENIGGLANYIFVLRQAKGDYFMWAADDDEWEPDFVSSLIPHLGTAGLVMTDCETVLHSTGVVNRTQMPRLSAEAPLYENAVAFLSNMQPSLVYGVYRTEALRECIPLEGFDFWDCTLLYTVLMRHGITTVPGYKYRAGVYGESYGIKLACPERGRLLFRTLVKNLIQETWAAKRLTFIEKIRLLTLAAGMVLSLRHHLNPIVKQQQENT